MENRIIKFKAWHKKEKLLCKVDVLTNYGAFLIGVKKGKDQIQGGMVVYAPEDGRFCEFKEIKLMQFTGLKDKNGKEIYEGDIVKVINSIFKIVWYGAGFYVFTKDDIYCTSLNLNNCISYTIIGNIFENENLLK